jgi:hypothetical protein
MGSEPVDNVTNNFPHAVFCSVMTQVKALDFNKRPDSELTNVGYPHRTHRSKKNRVKGYQYKREHRLRMKTLAEQKARKTLRFMKQRHYERE